MTMLFITCYLFWPMCLCRCRDLCFEKTFGQGIDEAALEKFESCKSSPDIKEIVVRSASSVSDEFKNYFESIRQRKLSQANLNFQEDAALKGGVVIAVGDLLLDFSLRAVYSIFGHEYSDKKSLVIVPAFNECGNIGRTVEEIRQVRKGC